MATTAAAAVVAKARRDVISYFLQQNAVSPENAVAYRPRRFIQRRQLARLLAAGIVHESMKGYWVDVPRWDAATRARHRLVRALVMLAAGAAAGIALLG
jgi:hypothetical protein